MPFNCAAFGQILFGGDLSGPEFYLKVSLRHWVVVSACNESTRLRISGSFCWFVCSLSNERKQFFTGFAIRRALKRVTNTVLSSHSFYKRGRRPRRGLFQRDQYVRAVNVFFAQTLIAGCLPQQIADLIRGLCVEYFLF